MSEAIWTGVLILVVLSFELGLMVGLFFYDRGFTDGWDTRR